MASGDPGAQAAIIALTKTTKENKDPTLRLAAAEVLKKIDPKVLAKARIKHEGQKKLPKDAPDPEVVAKAFILAVANKNVNEAAKYTILAERDEIKREMEKGMPPLLPKDPKFQIRIKDNGI